MWQREHQPIENSFARAEDECQYFAKLIQDLIGSEEFTHSPFPASRSGEAPFCWIHGQRFL